MVHLFRRSLLLQLLGVYLLFVAIVLASGLEADAVGQHQLKSQIRTSDLALAQEVAFDIFTKMDDTEQSLVELSRTVTDNINDIRHLTDQFNAFKIARSDIDRVYWLDGRGILRVSVSDPSMLGAQFSNDPIFALAQDSTGPVVEGGSVDTVTGHKVVTVGEAVYGDRGQFMGVVAVSLLLTGLSMPLRTAIAAQTIQSQHLIISILDDTGQLIASPSLDQLLQPMAGGPPDITPPPDAAKYTATTLPGAAAALAGQTVTVEGPGPNHESWLYSAVPVLALNWAVIVQRPVSELSTATTNFSNWLLIATAIFAVGGLLFWFMLMRRVVRPLHALASHNQSVSAAQLAHPDFTARADEIGGLARALDRLNRDVTAQLGELRTLLETSNAVVNSLDPHAVGRTIIREVRRLVDVQAAAVLVPDETGTLRVLASEGRAEHYEDVVRVPADRLAWPSARALHEEQPIQMVDDGTVEFPAFSATEGFRTILAIPIISKRVGGVVLVVHRRQAQPFTANEVDLLLTFANYATLAWEHAVLYERSDERLREVARENERLYWQANAERQTLSAIMGSISDALVITDLDGNVLYANPGARVLLGQRDDALETSNIVQVHRHLRELAEQPEEYDRDQQRAEAGELDAWLLETTREQQRRAFHLRLFDVRDEAGNPIGRGLRLRDVTRERELDQFKTTLLAAVGHELRTPLAVIKVNASTLLQDDVTWSESDQRHFLHMISAEADQLAELVSSLLDLSRSEAGLLQLKRAPYRVADLVQAASRRLNVEIPSLSIDLPADLPEVDVDAARIEVVIHNLLVNAAKYGNGTVHVSATAGDAQVAVRISDNGPGISPDDVPHIFERFYRAQYATRQQLGGTGLGLAICKAFVEAHQGTIWVDSDSSGTSITITLPTFAAPGNSVSEAESAPSALIGGTRHVADAANPAG